MGECRVGRMAWHVGGRVVLLEKQHLIELHLLEIDSGVGRVVQHFEDFDHTGGVRSDIQARA